MEKFLLTGLACCRGGDHLYPQVLKIDEVSAVGDADSEQHIEIHPVQNPLPLPKLSWSALSDAFHRLSRFHTSAAARAIEGTKRR